MFNLAIECSAPTTSVALCHQGSLIAERILPTERGSIETLAPAIADLVRGVSLSCISITCGPGSFTGLRIGMATAKMLAFAWGIPTAPVDTLDVIAEQQRLALLKNECYSRAIVIPVMNAFRKQVFTSVWGWDRQSNWQCLADSQVMDAAAWMKNPLAALDSSTRCDYLLDVEQVIVTGPVLEQYAPADIVEYSPATELTLTIAPSSEWAPRAAAVGWLGWKAFQAGRSVPAIRLLPKYLRASAAEDKQRPQATEQ